MKTAQLCLFSESSSGNLKKSLVLTSQNSDIFRGKKKKTHQLSVFKLSISDV